MHKIIASYLRTFSAEHEIGAMDEASQFERFVNFCVVGQTFPDLIELDRITTSDDDLSIDGIAVMVGEDLVVTAEEARALLAPKGRRRALEVNYIFVQAKRSEGFDLGEMSKFGNGVTALFNCKPDTTDDVISEFWEIHEVVVDNVSSVQDGRPRCSLYYATTGTWNTTSNLQQRAIDPVLQNLKALGYFHSVNYEPVDRDRLTRLWAKSRAPVEATFTVKGTVPLPTIAGVTEAYLALVPAKEFIEQVLSDDDGRIRSSVFEQNVRSFLGEDNPVNARIRAALATPLHHDRFAINNNGITIVAPDVKVQSDRVSVSDFQIVNGCQTCHVLYRSVNEVGPDVWLPLKIIEAEDPDVVAQLVASTNSQTTVEESQFLSIKPFTQQVEQYFNAFDGQDSDRDKRLYFERRTNQYAGQGISKMRVFDIPKLARSFASMFLDLPHVAYMYPTQVLKERAGQMFRPDHKEHVYHTAALALYRLELALGNTYVPSGYQSYKWHLLMIVRYLFAGDDMPPLASGKIERYCATIDAVLERGGKSGAEPFNEAVKIVEKVGKISRDRRKGQKYTDDLRSAALVARRAELRRQSAAASRSPRRSD